MGSYVKILQCSGDSMTVLVGRSQETEHSMSNWIKLFFHIWVGVKKGGERANREHRWEASVLIIGGYWPPALMDSRKWGFMRASCTCTRTIIKHYIWEEEEVKTVFVLWVAAAGTHAIMAVNCKKQNFMTQNCHYWLFSSSIVMAVFLD